MSTRSGRFARRDPAGKLDVEDYPPYSMGHAARARELIDQGTALDSACRIIVLEDQLAFLED
nr:hypothetical protein [Rhodococcus opacus]